MITIANVVFFNSIWIRYAILLGSGIYILIRYKSLVISLYNNILEKIAERKKQSN